ncbi:MAG: MxaK protein [Methylomonas sp.]|nr:MxaK protein [Methylomonas sp.]PPD20213.1 MAG: MxaK protein [Methylomonas sp.]PPD26268.1 MAG: MxaK protein [Methylomonas sp.]PPD37985.1 MAG: MxaK protein [Methylomonas sp.]PPD40367.1 MAG: MxaK protein [Methylomonas sp.]
MRALRHKLIWAALLASVLLATSQAWTIYRIHHHNTLIEAWLGHAAQRDIDHDDLRSITPQTDAPPELHLAQAIYLKQHQFHDQALAALSRLVGQGNSRLQSQSRYNLGNFYLSQAMTEIDQGRINQALPLLTLAKQAYRQALRLDTGFWDAKYNLEVAMALLPEFDRISQEKPDDDASKPSQLWTTLPGFPRGLP